MWKELEIFILQLLSTEMCAGKEYDWYCILSDVVLGSLSQQRV
jgi:hypothetical protein